MNVMVAAKPVEHGPARTRESVRAMNVISADSHVAEPPGAFIDYIDPKWRDRAPHVVHDEKRGDLYVVPGMPEEVIPMGLIACAGKPPEKMQQNGLFSEIHPGGYDAKKRLAIQEEDGIFAEVLYPTVGMLICNHADYDYKQACFDAYARWLQDFCSDVPDRMFGLGQSAARSPEDMVEELIRFKEMGFVGMTMPGIPAVEDYDSPVYDKVWATSVELDMPISVHILTSSKPNKAAVLQEAPRGVKLNKFHHNYKSCQDIIGLFIYTGVFDRHPELKLVTAEADAGWAPHFAWRSDHFYRIHRFHNKAQELKRMPSEYFFDHIYMTFQDDKIAWDFSGDMNARHLCWASDFPHSDSTYPNSLETIVAHSERVSDEVTRDIVHNNTKALYNLPV